MSDGPIDAPTHGRNAPVLVHAKQCESDRQLLRRFVAFRDEAAFALLVERHAPMVLSVCRRVLHDAYEAEDACQATFLVLARKAGSLRRPELLANWLYGVAVRAARKARRQMVRLGTAVLRGAPMQPADPTSEIVWRDLRPVLDQELNRLPAQYRTAVVLCYLEGLTAEAAARDVGCPRGTILSRLARARELLRSRLARRGLGLSVGILGLLLARHATASSPPSTAFLDATTTAALQFAAGHRAPSGVSRCSVDIAQGLLGGMVLVKLMGAAICLLGIGILAMVGWRLKVDGTAKVAALSRDDKELIQGAWRGVTLEQQDQKLDSERITFTFTGDQLRVNCLLFDPPWNAVFECRLDDQARPKRIDLIANGKVEMIGIYELDGDCFRLCTVMAGQDRPTDFAAHDNQWVWVFKRELTRDGLPK